VKILLEAGARVDERNRDGLTPLMLASGEGRTEVVQLLLRYGADPALKTPTGLSALDFANINKQAGPSRILKATLSERARKGGAPQPPPAAP
jgi:ankyrin repeat protein